MSLTRSVVLIAIQKSLLGTAGLFVDKEDANVEIAHLTSMLESALSQLKVLAPRTAHGTLTLVPGQIEYDGPADLWSIKMHTWGQNESQPAPWEPGYITRLPVVKNTENNIYFSFAPDANMISTLGSNFGYFYLCHHLLTEEQSTVPDTALPLLITLAQAHAMQLLMVRGASNPVAVKPGVGRIAKAAPAEVFEMLMASAKQQAKHL
jgi:hypothetical protein